MWSGTGSNCRPSAFQVNRAKRCADLQKRTSLTSGTALGGRCSVNANRGQYTPSTRQDNTPAQDHRDRRRHDHGRHPVGARRWPVRSVPPPRATRHSRKPATLREQRHARSRRYMDVVLLREVCQVSLVPGGGPSSPSSRNWKRAVSRSSWNFGSGSGFFGDVAAQDRVAGRGVRPVPLNEPLQEGAQGLQPLPVGVSRQGALDTRRTGRPDFVVLDVVAADTRDAANACAADRSPAAATPQRRCVPFTDHSGGQRPQWDILRGGPSAAAGSARGPAQNGVCTRAGPG